MVTMAWFKTSLLSLPQPATSLLMHLERLTSDCIYKGVTRCIPVLSREGLCNLAGCRWLVVVFIADHAASNRRLMAYVLQQLLRSRTRTLVFNIKRFVHLLRCAVPTITTLHLSGPLLRAAHVMVMGAY